MIFYGQWERWGRTPARSIPRLGSQAAWLPIIVALGGCAFLAAIQLRWALAFLRWPIEIVYGEALLQDHAARLLRGEALYQPLGQPSYSVATYTPLFYGVLALGQVGVGLSFLPARVLSVLAAASVVVLLGYMVARDGRGTVGGLLAAVMFIGLGFPTPLPSFALGKEDTFGVALGVAAIAILARQQSWTRIVLSALFAALAILTKQTLIAAALAGVVALLVQHRIDRAALFAVVSGGVVLATVLTFELTTHAFFANAVFANAQPFRLDVLQTNLATLKAYQLGPLTVAAFASIRRLLTRRSFEDVLLPIWWAGTLLPVIGLASPGSAQNYWIELAASSALLTASEILTWARGASLRNRLVGAVLASAPCVNVIVAGRLALIWLPALAQYNDPIAIGGEFTKLVERVRSTPGDVIAEPLDAVAFAGKPTLVEPWEADALYQSGTWNLAPVIDRVCTGDVGLAVLAHSLDDPAIGYQGYGLWPPPLVAAMRDVMVFDSLVAGRYVYVPRPQPQCIGH